MRTRSAALSVLSVLSVLAVSGCVLLASTSAVGSNLSAPQSSRKPSFSQLSGVVSLSSSSAWAVGALTKGRWQYPLVQRWDGSSWMRVPGLQPRDAELLAVAATNDRDVWAVGDWKQPRVGGSHVLAEHWDGTAWSRVETPSGPNGSRLVSVSAISSDDVWATGDVGSGEEETHPLVMHWDGVRWTRVPLRAPKGQSGALSGIDAVSPNDVWAVGGLSGRPRSGSTTWIEHWDGSSWSRFPSPDPGRLSSFLAQLKAISSDDVWAVGGMLQRRGAFPRPMVLHFDGTRWKQIRTPAGSPPGYLLSVDGDASDDVWAVGPSYPHRQGKTLTAHWTGHGWHVVDSPDPRQNSMLMAVSMAGPNATWAVGRTGVGHQGPLRLAWNGSRWVLH